MPACSLHLSGDGRRGVLQRALPGAWADARRHRRSVRVRSSRVSGHPVRRNGRPVIDRLFQPSRKRPSRRCNQRLSESGRLPGNVDRLLGQAHRHRVDHGQVRSQPHGLLLELVARHHPVHQADPLRLDGADLLPGEYQLLRPSRPDQPGITCATTVDPNRISGWPNTASSEATVRSHIIIRSHPSPARQ